MKDALERVSETFGVNELGDGLFGDFEFALRFELGGEIFPNIERPIPRFLQANERARSVASFMFAKPERLTFLFFVNDYKKLSWRPLYDFKKTGLTRSDFARLKSTLETDEDVIEGRDEDYYRHWYACSIEDSSVLDELIWMSTTREMPIEPCSSIKNKYLIDFDAGIAMQIYDDRGMDVIANSRGALLPTYRKFHSWLLDYNLEEMDDVFG